MYLKILFNFSLLFLSCGTTPEKTNAKIPQFSLNDFYGQKEQLSHKVDSTFELLDAKARISQMIVVAAGTNGKPTKEVEQLIMKGAVGGVLLLGGEKKQLIQLRQHFDSLAFAGGLLPLLYSSDAEPSLINRKITGTQQVPKTVDLLTKSRSDSVAGIITNELLSMGIRHNYAPVVDVSASNEAITNRTFGIDPVKVIELSTAFINTTQDMGVVATAKHFPGHGLVSGDTHHQLVTIDGEMKEVANYIPLIQQGVLSIMVGHIEVINNEMQTDGLPSSCSQVIVTDLLKNKLGFKGIIITDAMNMGAVQKIDKASLKSIEAGCDIILMEPNEDQLIKDAYEKYKESPAFRRQVDESVKKILRLKFCLNMFE